MTCSSGLGKSTTHRQGDPGLRVGCLFFSLGFLVFGAIFLWAFFTNARSNRPGNPVMRLIFGSVFSLFGLIGLTGLLLTLFGRRR
jgi:hypothetical protein